VSKVAGTASDKVEAEDGEIEDAKVSDGLTAHPAASKASQSGKPTPVEDAKAVKDSVRNTVTEVRKPSPAPAQTQTPRETLTTATQKADIRPTPLPAFHQASIPARPELNRNASSANGRVQHNLPSKPDVVQLRPVDHRMPPRPADRGSNEHKRDPRFPEHGGHRDTLRERGAERSASGAHSYGPERPSEREKALPGRSVFDDRHGGPSHPRNGRIPPRDDRSEQPPNDRPYPEPHASRRDGEASGLQGRDSAMPPPRSNITHHPDRAALIQGSQGHDRLRPAINAAGRPAEPPRPDHGHPDRTSRGPSPVRGEDRRPPQYESRRDDRAPSDGRRAIDEAARPHRAHLEEPHAPTGPRTGRTASAAAMHPDRFRESMKPLALAPAVDPNHGRLTNDSNFSKQGESQYGRLNLDNDIPSGPRLPNGNQPPARSGRNISAPQPQINTQLAAASSQNQLTASPVQERQIPSGPSRGSPRKPAPFPQHIATNSAPSTPVAQSPETAGIHPDRLRALQGSGVIASENPPQSQGRGLRQPPPPVSIPASGGPRGLNNQLSSPIGPSANRGGPPTGPAMSNDRSGRDKRFAGIQNMLQQERSGQGASIRGRGGRANNVNAASPVTSGPPKPSLPRPDQPPAREDLFAGRPNGGAPQQPEDDQYGRGGRRGGPRDGPRDAERRSGRHRSRSPAKEGAHKSRERPRGVDGPPDRDYRGGEGPAETVTRGAGGAERDMRDGRPPRDTRRSGRDDGQYRERDPRDGPERRDERDRRDGGGSGRKRGRGGDEVQGDRNFSDGKRQRR